MSRLVASGGAPWGALLLFLCACSTPAFPDVIHLRNGGTVEADSWEERGEDLIIHQGKETLVIPRADVARIDRAAVPVKPEDPARAGDTPTGGPGIGSPAHTAPPRSTGVAREKPTREEVERQVLDLRRRIRDLPLEREQNTRMMVHLVNYLGSEAYVERDLDEALARFQEALGFDPHDANAQFGLAVTYLTQERDLHARSILERAILEHAGDARMHSLLGDIYYAEERTEDALAAWERAHALEPNRPLRDKIDKLRREQSVDRSYQRSDAAHFTLKYDGEISGHDLGGEIIDFLEGQFSGLVTRFDYYPSQPIVVIVYPRRQFYAATQAEASVGGLFDGKIRVPSGGLKRLNPEARSVLLHELAHAFISGKSRNTTSRWLQEGIAQVIEGRITPAATRKGLAREYRAQAGTGAWGTRFSYPSALSFVEFLTEREGFYRLQEVMEATAGGATEDDAFQTVTRYTLDELRREWGESLARANLH